jgi:hypothetical protein
MYDRRTVALFVSPARNHNDNATITVLPGSEHAGVSHDHGMGPRRNLCRRPWWTARLTLCELFASFDCDCRELVPTIITTLNKTYIRWTCYSAALQVGVAPRYTR